MRLIDADKLEMKLLFDDSWDMEYPTYGVFQYQLWEAPTIEAIPIEWLKRWFEYQVWCGSSPTDRVHCKASDIIDDWYDEQNRIQWEKENEQYTS